MDLKKQAEDALTEVNKIAEDVEEKAKYALTEANEKIEDFGKQAKDAFTEVNEEFLVKQYHLITYGFAVVAVIIFLIVYRSYKRESGINKMARNTRSYIEEVGEQVKEVSSKIEDGVTNAYERAKDACKEWMDD